MVKPVLRFLFLRLIPGWLAALILVSVTFAWFQPLHSLVSSVLFSATASEVQTVVKYRVAGNESDRSLTVTWPSGAPRSLRAYQSESVAADYIDDQVLSRSQINTLLNWLDIPETPVLATPGTGIWQPAKDNYKQLVFRSPDSTFLDQILDRGFQSARVSFSGVKSGFFQSPVDPYGGIFLFTDRAPLPVEAGEGELYDLQVSRYNALTEQFLKEIWAINNQQWSVVTWVSLVSSAFLTLLPWLFFGRLKSLAVPVVVLLVIGFIAPVAFQFQWNWFYPFVLPILSPLFAWVWFADKANMRKQIAGVEQKRRDVTKLWVGHLLDEGKPEAAYRYLKEEDAQSKPYLEMWQLVGQGFERNRQYEKSVESYRQMLAIDSGNATAKQRIKKLTEIVDGSKTVAIAQTAGELPVGQVENLKLGRYEISKELGRGAMGIVYEAEDPKIHRKVALKVVHLKSLGVDEVDQVKQRFFREAQAAGKLNHPNIVTVYDVGEEHDVAYIAMDLLKGKPLSSMIGSNTFELVKIVKWIAEAAEALGYAHENDIVHRDVKPANMIIEEKTSRLKLTDFGVARIAGVQQTQTGIVLGSPSYMSPEQIRGEKLTGATDIFSLGVTLYQSITGELPFAGDTLPGLAYAITQTKQESPRNLNDEVPVSLVRIVNKSLQKEPSERYATAHDFAKALNKWVTDHT